ncbi:hypothetical protein DPMN_158442 [Dreissena polymorpha]|uniref:Uncharacterized protein n=1 Tax=Dreissena polymorpha TaxID=45954 RepID=A0A9D4EJ57_DREPO|nr:hypothetical protein DPMN_158442 [Dreissena polymorpha]
MDPSDVWSMMTIINRTAKSRLMTLKGNQNYFFKPSEISRAEKKFCITMESDHIRGEKRF